MSRVERLVGVRSASGSATLTRLLELAAARSGLVTLNVHVLLLAHYTPHFPKLRVMGHHLHVKALHERMSTDCPPRVQYRPQWVRLSHLQTLAVLGL